MNHEPAVPIGTILRKLREGQGLSQINLAKKTGVDPRTLTAIEKGRIINPSLANLKKIAEGLGLNLKGLFGCFESELESHFYLGSQKGEFTLAFPKEKTSLLSYLPKEFPYFAGKLVLESKGRLTPETIRFRGPVFLQMIFGKANFSLENKDCFLKEGQNLFFDGRLSYSLQNPLIREATALIFTAPSFLNS